MSQNYSQRLEDEEKPQQEPFLDKPTAEHSITEVSGRAYHGRSCCLRLFQWLRLIIELGLIVTVVLFYRASRQVQLLGDRTGFVPSCGWSPSIAINICPQDVLIMR